MRKILVKKKLSVDDGNFEKFMGQHLVKTQIDNSFSNICLKDIITEEFTGLYLTQTEKLVLKKIGELKKVKSKDYIEFKELGVSTMQRFTNNYLTKLSEQHLLLRRQEGKLITYELRGISVFALEYELLT